jgi:hypothetical protein
MREIPRTLALMAILALVAPISHAGLITFDLSYTGIQNSASANGTITFDDAVLPNIGDFGNVSSAALGVTAFSITVAGASSGNGTFGLPHVTNWIWRLFAPLNLTAELVGQSGFQDFNWCGFDFTGCMAPAPGGIAPFTLRANAETGDILQLVSMRQATTVPEPATLALISLGLLGFAGLRRRKHNTV